MEMGATDTMEIMNRNNR